MLVEFPYVRFNSSYTTQMKPYFLHRFCFVVAHLKFIISGADPGFLEKGFICIEYILLTKSRGYSNIINHSIYQTNIIKMNQLVLISQVI